MKRRLMLTIHSNSGLVEGEAWWMDGSHMVMVSPEQFGVGQRLEIRVDLGGHHGHVDTLGRVKEQGSARVRRGYVHGLQWTPVQPERMARVLGILRGLNPEAFSQPLGGDPHTEGDGDDITDAAGDSPVAEPRSDVSRADSRSDVSRARRATSRPRSDVSRTRSEPSRPRSDASRARSAASIARQRREPARRRPEPVSAGGTQTVEPERPEPSSTPPPVRSERVFGAVTTGGLQPVYSPGNPGAIYAAIDSTRELARILSLFEHRIRLVLPKVREVESDQNLTVALRLPSGMFIQFDAVVTAIRRRDMVLESAKAPADTRMVLHDLIASISQPRR